MKVGSLKTESTGKSVYCSPFFVLGAALATSAQGWLVAALKYGTVMLISCTPCFTLIFTAIFTPIILKEKFDPYTDGISIYIISIGITTALLQ